MTDTLSEREPPDCRQQLAQIRPKIIKRWLAIILVFIGIIPYLFLMQLIFGDTLSPESFTMFVMMPYGLIYLALISSLLGSTCPNCGKSLYVYWKIPCMVKSE